VPEISDPGTGRSDFASWNLLHIKKDFMGITCPASQQDGANLARKVRRRGAAFPPIRACSHKEAQTS